MNTTPQRQYRELSDVTKLKISQSMKGRSKSDTHREAISKGMKTIGKVCRAARPQHLPSQQNQLSLLLNMTKQSKME